jgi:hypothetical protein
MRISREAARLYAIKALKDGQNFIPLFRFARRTQWVEPTAMPYSVKPRSRFNPGLPNDSSTA